MEHVINKDNKLLMSDSTFGGLWKQSVYPCDIEDSNAPKRIAEKLLKGLCFSKIGMITCCKRCRKPNGDQKKDVLETGPTDKTLQVAVLLNEMEKAATLWHRSKNPMMTSLISSMYLTALANIQEHNFEENLQDQYNSHAKLFVSQAVHLLEKMFTDNERMAIHALDNVCDVWDYRESPLHFGHQFNIEEFISHSSNQKDASKRFSSNNDAADTDVHLDTESEKIVTKGLSSRKQKLANTTSVYSISMSGWFSFIKIRPQKDCNWSPQRMFLHIFNIWNTLDFLCSTLYILGFCMYILDSNLIAHIRRIFSIALFIMFLRLLNCLLLSKLFGIIIIIVKEMVLTIRVVRIMLLSGIMIDPSVERCPTGDWITPVIAAFYMMLTNWLLLNIVIAMFRIFRSVWYATKCSCFPPCPCNDEPEADDKEDMLKKQQQFAKEIIAEEKHQKKLLKKQLKIEKHRKRT
ncbi:unnamed protein product [Mytilus coruscus]|uniref:TRPM-like domain-containing protein n=1 Tax=Mytilus coruscus TaxID=42192 RepID=A0A6J8CQW3_MYTCO|nr:unnamed protein product [Mytilus coruscus]